MLPLNSILLTSYSLLILFIFISDLLTTCVCLCQAQPLEEFDTVMDNFNKQHISRVVEKNNDLLVSDSKESKEETEENNSVQTVLPFGNGLKHSSMNLLKENIGTCSELNESSTKGNTEREWEQSGSETTAFKRDSEYYTCSSNAKNVLKSGRGILGAAGDKAVEKELDKCLLEVSKEAPQLSHHNSASMMNDSFISSNQSPTTPSSSRKSLTQNKMAKLLMYDSPGILSPLNTPASSQVKRGFRPPAFKKSKEK